MDCSLYKVRTWNHDNSRTINTCLASISHNNQSFRLAISKGFIFSPPLVWLQSLRSQLATWTPLVHDTTINYRVQCKVKRKLVMLYKAKITTYDGIMGRQWQFCCPRPARSQSLAMRPTDKKAYRYKLPVLKLSWNILYETPFSLVDFIYVVFPDSSHALIALIFGQNVGTSLLVALCRWH